MKPGYKQSEVGVIPDEWDVVPFAELFAFRNGVNADKNSYGKGVSFVNVLEPITYSHIKGPEITGRVTLPEPVISSYAVRRGDVLFNRTSETQEEVGLAATYVGAERVVFGGFVIRGRPLDQRLDPVYSGYALRAPFIRSQIIPMGQGAVRANVGQRNLGLVLTPLPPLPEQRAIADALGDVDALLGALDQLIAKKRDLKQAAMQQLLTGQTRLSGFHGEWQMKRLGDLGVFLKGSGVKKDESQSGTLPCIRYGEIYTRHNNYIKIFHSFISAEVAQSARLLKKGDVLFAGSGETKEEIGKCVTLVDDVEAYAGGDIVILRPQAVDPVFLGFCLNTPAVNRQKASRGQGDAVVHIGPSALADIALNLPPLCEQTAIAEVLKDMDTEMAGLEQRRYKTYALKQGMMQELLTGKTRLVALESVHA